jgi:predicted permease
MMGNLWRDISFSIRMMRKNPGFTLFAVVILAFGIGANTAIYGLVNSFLWSPIMAKNPHEIVGCYWKNTKHADRFSMVSYPNYKDLQKSKNVFSGLIAHTAVRVGVTEGEITRRLFAEIITSNYFDVLGVSLFKGRAFRTEEEAPGSGIPVVIVSYQYWMRKGSDPDMVGKILLINGQRVTVVGIAPRGFTGTLALLSLDLYMPIGMYHLVRDDQSPTEKDLGSRDAASLTLVGRLRPGMTIAAADSQLKIASDRLVEAYPAINKDYTYIVRPLSRMNMDVKPTDESVLTQWAVPLMIMPGIVLLIACINLAGMLLARGAARQKEFAVRSAIGSSRRRILRQLLTESLLLSLIGGCAGLGLSCLVNDLLASNLNKLDVMRDFGLNINIQVTPGHQVLLAAILFSVLATVLFGFWPALKMSRLDLMADLKEKTGNTNAHGNRWSMVSLRNILITGQIALSLVLVTIVGLYVKGVSRSAAIDAGFIRNNSIIAEIDPSLVRYDETRSRELYNRLLARLRNLPEIEETAMAYKIPFTSFGQESPYVRIPDRLSLPKDEHRDTQAVLARYNSVSDNYFKTLGIAIVQGREFTRAETESSGGMKVAVIDKSLAKKLWPNEDPLGRTIVFENAAGDPNENAMKVVGIASTIINDFIMRNESQVYVPFGQNYKASMFIHVRVKFGAESMLPLIRREIQNIDPQLPILKLKTLDAHIASDFSLCTVQMMANIFLMFATLSMFLTAIGIYGARAYNVARRTREIGIRIALGAPQKSMVWLILREGVALTLTGIVLGLILSVGAARLVQSVIYTGSAFDLLAFSIAPLAVAFVSLLAAYIPARRASRIDPVTALHRE